MILLPQVKIIENNNRKKFEKAVEEFLYEHFASEGCDFDKYKNNILYSQSTVLEGGHTVTKHSAMIIYYDLDEEDD